MLGSADAPRMKWIGRTRPEGELLIQDARVARKAFWRLGGIILLIVGLAQVTFVIFQPDIYEPGIPIPQRAFSMLVGILMSLFYCLMGWAMLKSSLSKRPCLVVGSDSLTVDHPAVLAKPLVVSKESIRNTMIESPPRSRRKARLFPVKVSLPGEAGPMDDFLVIKGRRCPFPLIATAEALPNLLFFFEEPVELPRVGMGLSTFFSGASLVRPPISMEIVQGIVFRVKDAEVARRLLNTWNLSDHLDIHVDDRPPGGHREPEEDLEEIGERGWVRPLLDPLPQGSN